MVTALSPRSRRGSVEEESRMKVMKKRTERRVLAMDEENVGDDIIQWRRPRGLCIFIEKKKKVVVMFDCK